jgi:methyl-accepting chemotaxis protein
MALALNRFRIRSRIYGGFAALIVLVLAVALFGATQFSATGNQVGSLVTVSDQMARVLTVQRLLETLNRASLRYQTKGDKALAKEFEESQAKATTLVRQSIEDARSEERRASYRELADGLAAYKGDFERLIQLADASEQASAALSKTGGEVVGTIGRAVALGRKNDDQRVTNAMRDLGEGVLTVRLASARFAIFKSDEVLKQLRSSTKAVEETFAALEGMALGDELKALVAPARTSFAAYAKTAEEKALRTVEVERMFETRMVPGIAAMQQQLATALARMAEEFEGTKAVTQARVARASLAQEAAAGAAVILGLIVAYLIGRSIAAPLGAMTGVMRRLAAGDKAVAIPGGDGRDEIADMAGAVDVFKHNMIEAERLAAEQAAADAAKIVRAQHLEGLTHAFETKVGQLVGTLAQAATEMEATAGSMSATAEQANQQSATVAAASEETSVNVQTVATAT